jgi:hypothetical protein
MATVLALKHAHVMRDGQGLCVMWLFVRQDAIKALVTIALAAVPASQAGRATCATSQLATHPACRESVCKAPSLIHHHLPLSTSVPAMPVGLESTAQLVCGVY